MQGRSVKNHMLSHTNEWKFSCTLCFRKFAKENWLQSHMEIVHPQGLKQIEQISSTTDCPEIKDAKATKVKPLKRLSKKILCELCGETFLNK